MQLSERLTARIRDSLAWEALRPTSAPAKKPEASVPANPMPALRRLCRRNSLFNLLVGGRG